jgi:hypothetical protein
MSDDIVEAVFQLGDFVPHVVDERVFVAEYGRGIEHIHEGTISRTYFDRKCHRVMISKSDSDVDERYRTIDELVIGFAQGPTPATHFHGDLCRISLATVDLGDSIEKFKTKVKGAIRPTKSSFMEVDSDVYYVNPDPNDSSLFQRFYVRNDKIIAFSVGVTE